MGVLILCPETTEERVRRAIDRLAPLDWELEGRIRLLRIPNWRTADRGWVTGKAVDHLRRSPEPHDVITVDLEVDFDKVAGRAALLRVAGITKFEKVLPTILKKLNLDWLSHLDSTLRNSWHHGDINREYLENWIEQFQRCGRNGWVAEGLLKVLDFWSDSRIRRGLNITPDGLSGFDCVSVNRHRRAGKSADAIASLVQKQLDAGGYDGINPKVMDLRDALLAPDIQRILYVEDCLITGNEMVRVLTALMGRRDVYGDRKADRLDDPELLRRKYIRLRFGVVANGGFAYVRRFLEQEGFANIEFEVSEAQLLPTLTNQGLDAVESDVLCDDEDCIRDIEKSVIRTAFSSQQVWGGEEQTRAAMAFCEGIGRQLYRRYLEKRRKTMSDRRLDESALGIRGLALALAFSHSVPKETLPLFWMGGRIKWGGIEHKWRPLFQNAE